MTAKLKALDLQSDILANLHKNGRISTPRYLAALRKLTDRASAILSKMS
jgi:hypothetical protein